MYFEERLIDIFSLEPRNIWSFGMAASFQEPYFAAIGIKNRQFLKLLNTYRWHFGCGFQKPSIAFKFTEIV